MYLGEDLQEPWAGDEDEEELAAEQMERAKRFEAIRAYHYQMSLLIPAVTCNVATEEKDPENYDVRVFKYALDDCVEVDLMRSSVHARRPSPTLMLARAGGF